MNNYQQRKEAARQRAIEWSHVAADHACSYAELLADQALFARLARRYGLTREFRENGIL